MARKLPYVRLMVDINSFRIEAQLEILDVYLDDALRRRTAGSTAVRPRDDAALEKKIEPIEARIKATEGGELGRSSFGFLCATPTPTLSPFEILTLILALAPDLDAKYSSTYAYLQGSVTCSRPTIDLAMQLFGDPGDHTAFTASAPLMKRHILQEREAFESRLPLAQRSLSLDDRILGFLYGQPDLDHEIHTWVTLLPFPKDPPRVPVGGDILEKTTRMAAECFAGGQATSRPIFHLLGRPGAGRGALAEVVCRRASAPLLVADVRGAGSTLEQVQKFWRLGRESYLNSAGILVENFDDLLEEGSEPALAALLQTFQDFETPLVFLCGTREWRPPSLPQTSPFVSIRCPEPSTAERVRSWEQHLESYDEVTAPDLEALAASFDFTDGDVRDVVSAARSASLWEHGMSKGLTLSSLRAASRKHALPNLGELARRTERVHTWESIKLPPGPLRQLKEIACHIKQAGQVFDRWGFAREFQYGLGLAACFEGASGTGKTLAASIVAAEAGQELITTDLSAIQSKYIGDTNKHLKKVFDEAQACNAILFIDEADAIFSRRTEVRDSIDRYANSEVAFLLQKIEEYRGTVILATNLKKGMDPAFLRRMRFMIHFPLPEEDMRLEIWNSIFPAGAPLDKTLDLSWFARRLKISGGNIKNIAIRAAFIAAGRSKPETRVIDAAAVIEAAKREYEKLGMTYPPMDPDVWKGLEKIA